MIMSGYWLDVGFHQLSAKNNSPMHQIPSSIAYLNLRFNCIVIAI